MPKIRGVKPEIWSDDKFVEASMPARLLFIALFNMACDNGHVHGSAREVRRFAFPDDPVDGEELLAELESVGLIERPDKGLTILPNFRKHQVRSGWFTCCDLPECLDPKGGKGGRGMYREGGGK